MADPELEENCPSPPKRESYTFDFDTLDESINPFQSKSKLGQSPPKNGGDNFDNPFKPKARLSCSPSRSENVDNAEGKNATRGSDSKKSSSSPSPSPHIINNNEEAGSSTQVVTERSNSEAYLVNESTEDVWCDAVEETSQVEREILLYEDKDKPKSDKALTESPESRKSDLTTENKDGKTEKEEKIPVLHSDSEKNDGEKEKKTEKEDDPPVVDQSSAKKKTGGAKKQLKKKSKLKPPENVSNQETTDKTPKPAPKDLNEQENISSPTETVSKKTDTSSCSMPDSVTEKMDTSTSPDLSSKKMDISTSPDPNSEKTDPSTEPDAIIKKTESEPSNPTIKDLKAELHSASQMTESLETVHEFSASEYGDMSRSANEGFVPTSDVFSDTAAWEMLEKFGEGGQVKESDNARESLFVKFDPLTQGAAESPEPARTKGQGSSSEVAEEPATASEDDLMLMNTPSPGKTAAGGGRQHKAKHPAARALDNKIEGAAGEPCQANNVNNLLMFSPAQSDSGTADMQRQISSDSTEAVVQLVQVLKYSQTDWNKLKQELELNFQAQLLNKEKEWSKKLADRDKKIASLEEQSQVLKQTNEDMRAVVAEFEKTISQLQAEKEKSTNASHHSLQDVIRERDQALDDLQSVETAFSNLHQRYEKTKGVVEGFKQNEEVLKKCVADYQAKLKKADQKLQELKQKAEEKLERANIEIEKERKAHNGDMVILQAQLKKAELQVQSLEKNLEQKVKHNQELTSILDEVIAKVGDD